MNTPLMLSLELPIGLAASAAVLYTLSTPLKETIEQICPNEQAARFWLTYTRIMLVIAPLILVLIVDMMTNFASPIDSLRMTLLATLGGLLIGLHRVGLKLGRFVVTPTSEKERPS